MRNQISHAQHTDYQPEEINQGSSIMEAFFEVASDLMVILDHNDTILRANPALTDILGYTPEQVVGQQPHTFIHPDEIYEFSEQMRRVDETPIQNLAYRFQHAEGGYHWLAWSAQADADHIYGIGRDITDEMLMQNELELLRMAVDATETSVVITDAADDFPIIYANNSFELLTGYGVEEIIGRNCRFLQGQDQDQPGLETVRAALANGESCTTVVRNYRKDGTLFYNELRLSPIRDRNNVPRYFVGVQNDVTERVQRETNRSLNNQVLRQQVDDQTRKLAESHTRLQNVINNSPIILLEIDRDGTILVNEGQGLAQLGMEQGELVGMNIFTLYASIPEVINGIRQALNGEGTTERVELGGMVYETHYTPRYDDQGQIISVVSVSHDITAQVRAQQQTETALEKTRDLNKVHRNFAAMVSHEYRRPLTIIMSAVQLLEMTEPGDIPEERKARYHRIYSTIDNMIQMIADIMTLGKTNADNRDFNPEPTDLLDLCETLALQHDQGQNRIRTAFPDQPLTAVVDASMLSLALGNLLSNAVKYSEAKVYFSLTISDNTLVFTVQDRGIGIPEPEQEKLFRYFYRASNALHIQGNGLGLAIVRQAVQAHDGYLTYRSAEGMGTTFTIRLPYQPPAVS